MRQSFSAHPLALLSVCFACGVAAARFASMPLIFALSFCLIATLLTTLFFARRRETSASVSLMAAFLFAGWTLYAIERGRVEPDSLRRLYDEGVVASGDPLELTGALVAPPESAPGGFYLTLRVERIRFKEREREAKGMVQLFAPVNDEAARVEYDELELRYGARINVMAAPTRAESFRNPGVSSLTEYLERRGLDATATVKSPLLVERLEDERVFLPLALIFRWRQTLLAMIDERFNRETAGVLKAALLGNRHYLSRPTAERFREGGTFHILVISGLHISFIGGVVFLIMRRVTKRKSLQLFTSVLFLWAYSIAVGAESSVVRAALTFTVMALAPLLHRRARSLNALGCAALLLLILRPSELFDPSFQLTFLSVLAIITLAWPLLEKMRAIGGWKPSRETPRPPQCSTVLRALAEALFWSEREWKREMAGAVYSYRLWKSPAAARLERWRVQRALRYMFSALLVSASVQLMLLPLLVLYFHRLSLASFVLNVGVGAMMATLALLSLLALLLGGVSSTLAAPFIRLAELLNWLMVHSVDPFAHAHLASIRLPEYQGAASTVYALYYLPLIALAATLSRWQPLRKEFVQLDEERAFPARNAARMTAVTLLALAALIIFNPLSARRPDGRLRVDFLDVGQGDAALVTMPDGTTMLVDGGGRPTFNAASEGAADFERDARSIGEAVVSEYLWWRGLDRVDYVVATHADADHIDGLNDILRNFSVRAAFAGRAPLDDPEFKRFAASAEEAGVPLHIIARGDTLRFGAASVEVLWPERTSLKDAPSRNNDSVVLRLRLGDRTFLLTGDIERQAEAALSNSRESLKSDVVKVAHHGSKTSSTEEFIKASAPSFAVISVGLSSIFGHPHQEVLERWRASGAQILTTGRSGTITVSTDGSDLKVETFVGD